MKERRSFTAYCAFAFCSTRLLSGTSCDAFTLFAPKSRPIKPFAVVTSRISTLGVSQRIDLEASVENDQKGTIGPVADKANNKKKKALRRPMVYKHLFRHFDDISIDCWVSTVNARDFFLSCGYTSEEIDSMVKDFSPLLDMNVRAHLAPHVRFLVQTLGGGTGDMSWNENEEQTMMDDDEECTGWSEDHPHNLMVSQEAKAAVPVSFFATRLERSVAPRHAYLVHHKSHHGQELLKNNGQLLKDFLSVSGGPAEAFAALCRQWDTTTPEMHTVERVNAFERAFHQGLIGAVRNDPIDDLQYTPGQMVELLLHHGANYRETDKQGASPLHWAAGTGSVEGVRALLEAPANAAEDGSVTDTVLSLCGAKDGATPLHWACCGVGHNSFGCGGHDEVCRVIFDEAGKGASDLLDAPTYSQNTPLMWACWSGSLDVIKELIKRGAHPHFLNGNGCGCAHAAASGGHLAVCRYLQEELALDFTTEDKDGNTPLDHAITYGHDDVAKWILNMFHTSSNGMAVLEKELKTDGWHEADVERESSVLNMLDMQSSSFNATRVSMLNRTGYSYGESDLAP